MIIVSSGDGRGIQNSRQVVRSVSLDEDRSNIPRRALQCTSHDRELMERRVNLKDDCPMKRG